MAAGAREDMGIEPAQDDIVAHAPVETGFGRIDRYRARFRRRAFPRHAHGYYAFATIEAGAERIFARGREHVVAPGETFLLNPGDVHTGAPFDAAGWSYRMLVLEEAQMAALICETSGKSDLPLFRAPVAADPHLAAAIRAAAAPESGALALEESLLALARIAAGATDSDDGQGRDETGPLARIRDYLAAHADERILLSDLCALSGLSRGYLVTAFSRRYGLPPAAFQFQLRLERARLMLMSGGRSLADVALACGFYDQSDLSRHFTRSFGIAPGRYRRQMNIRQELSA